MCAMRECSARYCVRVWSQTRCHTRKHSDTRTFCANSIRLYTPSCRNELTNWYTGALTYVRESE
jgi:hypothetical protein